MQIYNNFSGEWNQGQMHGNGVYTSPNGYEYQGGFYKDLRHGLGKKSYANGDFYEVESRFRTIVGMKNYFKYNIIFLIILVINRSIYANNTAMQYLAECPKMSCIMIS